MPNRPKYLNLLQIRLPVPGIVSIMHRISGAVLFLALPLILCGLQQSLGSFDSFIVMKEAFSSPLAKIVMIALVWGYLHHMAAGIRHLLLDIDVGTELATARMASVIVLVVSIALTMVAGALIW
jgi:succinate dehydrogenase / fumarate reductase, cytochrome b subunit